MSAIASVAIQGEPGSNSAVAAQALLGESVRLLSCLSFGAVFEALQARHALHAVIPVENTTAGLVLPVWDRLLGLQPGAPLFVRAEARVRIEFVLAGLPTRQRAARIVLAHPVAAAQCARMLDDAGLLVEPCHDTAGAARLVAEARDETRAALCPPAAAHRYGLEVYRPDCGDERETCTRFLWVSVEHEAPVQDADRTFCALWVGDRPGALQTALATLAAHHVNLCGLHSRPWPGRPGRYAFVLEAECGAGAPALQAALIEMQHHEVTLRVIGSVRAPAWPQQGVSI